MNERERIIHLWFDMWLKQQDLGIDSIFTEDVIYTESWSPKYESRKTVKHWFDEWNTRGKVLVWDIKQFFHKENQTIVEWYFKNKMNNGIKFHFVGFHKVAQLFNVKRGKPRPAGNEDRASCLSRNELSRTF